MYANLIPWLDIVDSLQFEFHKNPKGVTASQNVTGNLLFLWRIMNHLWSEILKSPVLSRTRLFTFKPERKDSTGFSVIKKWSVGNGRSNKPCSRVMSVRIFLTLLLFRRSNKVWQGIGALLTWTILLFYNLPILTLFHKKSAITGKYDQSKVRRYSWIWCINLQRPGDRK